MISMSAKDGGELLKVVSFGRSDLYKAVIFDFDGTLVDSSKALNQVYHHLAEKYGLQKISPETIEEIRSLPVREKLRLGGIPIYKLPRLAREARQEYASHIEQLQLYDGISDALEKLQEMGIKLYILSSNSTSNIRRFLASHSLDCFKGVYSSPNILKKDAGIRKLLQNSAYSSEQVVYIGDEIRDVLACRKVPVDMAAVSWGHDTAELLASGQPTFLINKPADIVDILFAR